MDTELDFDPPHGQRVFDVTYDGPTLSFQTERGRRVTMRGTARFFHLQMEDDEYLPEAIGAIFEGIYEGDDFCYPVEVHFVDQEGFIYEKPQPLPECMVPTDVFASHVRFVDPNGCEVVCIRDPNATWEPEKGRIIGRVGHLLVRY